MIFLIGGAGFVGSGFARVLEAAGREFAIVERDNYGEFVGKECDLLINANGNSKKPLAKSAPMEEFDLSVRSVRATLTDFRCRFYLHLSTCDVYADCSSPETTSEAQVLDPARQSPYGFHKYVAEQCVRHGAPEWLIFRCGGFVGPGMRKNAIFDIMQGGPLWLDPESELQFLHTESAARIALALADGGVKNEVINLCGNGVVRLSEVMAAAGGEVKVNPGSPRVRYDVNIAKLTGLIEAPETRKTVLEFMGRR